MICEIISLALYLTTFFVQSFREQWYSPQFLALRIFIIVLGAALLAFTIQNVCYSPKRRHPKNSSDLDDLDTKKSAYKYYCKRYSAKSEELQKEYAALMQSKFSKLMQLDHDLGGVALKCKVTGVNKPCGIVIAFGYAKEGSAPPAKKRALPEEKILNHRV